MTPDTPLMPPRDGLAMHPQNLAARPEAASLHHSALPLARVWWRLGVFAPALIGTAALLAGMFSWLNMGGMTWLEWTLLGLIGTCFIWVALSVSTVAVGVAGVLRRSALTPKTRPQTTPQTTPTTPLSVALLVPIYNEVPEDVFGNASAMLDDLARRNQLHRFSLFILSDTRDAQIAETETRALAMLRRDAPSGARIWYRRRAENTDKKVGNLVDWVTGWGARYDAMLVLDADSLMSGRSICALTDTLAADPDAGLVQSFPTLIGAETVFARLQQFSNIAYGWLLAEGLALWSRTEGNYWGHNAILRTRAFAACAGLPHLSGDRLILSHDFVEAGLLRRAGWRVRFIPQVTGSFEETPGTLIDYVIRDRRWCRGNLQHLRLLAMPGLHPVSRFHLFAGAMAYLLSPAWLALLIAWALLGKNETENVIRYFKETSPLYPDWPQMTQINEGLFLAIMYVVLLTPKLVGAVLIAAHPKAHRTFGGRRKFALAVLIEVTLSIAYAPVLMIQQSRAVLRALLTRDEPWMPQKRAAQGYDLRTLARVHWIETTLGALLLAGLAAGLVSWWLTPIIASLVLAVPLSALSSVNLVKYAPAALRIDSPHTLREPAIVTRARLERDRMKALLNGSFQEPAE